MGVTQSRLFYCGQTTRCSSPPSQYITSQHLKVFADSLPVPLEGYRRRQGKLTKYLLQVQQISLDAVDVYSTWRSVGVGATMFMTSTVMEKRLVLMTKNWLVGVNIFTNNSPTHTRVSDIHSRK